MKRFVNFLLMAFIIVVLAAITVWYVDSQATVISASTVDSLTANAGQERNISEIASNYIGEMNRDIFKIKTSLYLPWQAQAILSALLMLVTLVITTFMPKARRVVMVITSLIVLRHLLWRGVETLTFEFPERYATTGDFLILGNTLVGLLIYGAEIIAFFTMIIGYFQTWGQTEHQSISIANIPANQYPSVDVFVCSYNEPMSVVYRTLVGCKSIDYPKKQVYLLDDGNRAEMAEMCQRIGVNYITRTQNTHAKAGNLNNAMAQTNGDLILVFDADHVPCTTFLKETVGFFTEGKMAFVQTPQHFFTEDPFQRNLVASEVNNNEQDLFFHMIQPGNDYWGATFFAGSGAIFRRSALQEIGGFAVETITEDVHTGLRLHSRGWKSLYYNRDLSAGLAQDSFADFIKQRLRWGRGMTQILFYDNPMFVRGLSFAQRICYFAGIWYFFHGLPRFLFLVAPLFFLLLGFRTVNASFVEIAIYYLPSFMCLFLGYTIVSRGIRHSFWSEVYESAQCVYLMYTTFWTTISPGRSKFRVTPKGTLNDVMNFNWAIVFPQIIIAALIFIGLVMGIVRAIYTPEYWGGILTNAFWSSYNIILLVASIYVALERPQLRIAPRVNKRIRCEVRLLDGTIAVGYTTNLSESGVAVMFESPVPISGTVALKILDWDINESSVYTVQAVRSSRDRLGRHYVGFRIVNRTEEQHQKMIRHMFGTAELWSKDYIYTQPVLSFFKLLFTPLRLASAVEVEAKRRTARFDATLPCMIEVDGRYIMGQTNEISESGMSVMIRDEKLFQKGQTIRLRVQWNEVQTSDLYAQIMRIENAGKGNVNLGLNFVNLTKEQRIDVIQHIHKPWDGLVRVAPAMARMVRCQLVTQSGQQVPCLTSEISEMGVVLSPQGAIQVMPEEKVTIRFQWDDQSENTYSGVFMDAVQRGGGQAAGLLVYFNHQDMKALDTLSMKLHEPVETKVFGTLHAG